MPVSRVPASGRRVFRWLSRRTRPAVVAVALAVVALTGSGCGSAPASVTAGPPQVTTNMTLGAVPAEGATGFYIAQNEGLFARAGLRVTVKNVTTSAVVIPDLLHGSVQVASGQYVPYIAAGAAGVAKLKIIAPGFALGKNVNEIMARAHSPVKGMADLKGKTIAVNAFDSEVSDLLYSALAAYGITPAEVHLVAIPFPLMGTALAAGKVDAAYMTEPYVTIAGQKNGDVGIYDLNTGSAQNFPIAGYAVLASYAQEHPRAVAAFARAVEEGNRIADSSISELQHAFIVALHLTPHVADLMATGTYPTRPDADQLQRVVNLMLRYGQLKKPVNVKSMLTLAA
jgi:NitT/TauT family transport system substrate-binding protein